MGPKVLVHRGLWRGSFGRPAGSTGNGITRRRFVGGVCIGSVAVADALSPAVASARLRSSRQRRDRSRWLLRDPVARDVLADRDPSQLGPPLIGLVTRCLRCTRSKVRRLAVRVARRRSRVGPAKALALGIAEQHGRVSVCAVVVDVGGSYRFLRFGDGLLLLQVLVHEADGGRAVADRRGDACDRAVPDVARGEHTRHARLEREGFAARAPVRTGLLEDVRPVST
jgi:hypothetical protein